MALMVSLLRFEPHMVSATNCRPERKSDPLARESAMKRSLTLAQKGFLIVGVPLLFELALLLILGNVLAQTEREVETEMRARKIATIMNRFQATYGGNVAAVTGYFLGGGSTDYLQKFRDSKLQIAEMFQQLSALVPSSSPEQTSLDSMKATSDEGFKGLEEIVGQVKERNLASAILMFKALKPLIQRATHKMQAIIDDEENIARTSSEQQTKSRIAVKQIILVGTILNILLAIILAVFFNRHLTSRLSTMFDNTLRLSAREPLNKPVGGADEIANLDHVFHVMADALDEANRQKNELLEMVAHDLRSPLMSVQTSLELLASTAFGKLPETATSEARTASNNVTRLIHLINDLLTLERMDAGQLKLNKKEVSLSFVTECSLDVLSSYAKSKNIDIIYPDDAPMILADPDRQISHGLQMNKVRLVVLFIILPALACPLVSADEVDQIFGPIDRLIEPHFKSTADKDQFVVQNMWKLQAAAESYAAHHAGKFPTKVDDAFKSYFQLGEADDKNFSPFSAALNPFSKKKEWPNFGGVANSKEDAASKLKGLKPGTVVYISIKNGSGYVIAAVGSNGKPIRQKGQVLILTHDPVESAKANMKVLQWSAESYAEHHMGKFPKEINDDFKLFFPGGDFRTHRSGRPLLNPFTGQKQWPVSGSIDDIARARKSAPSKLAPGLLEYSCVAGGRLYAIRCGAANGKAMSGEPSAKSTLIIGKDGDGTDAVVTY